MTLLLVQTFEYYDGFWQLGLLVLTDFNIFSLSIICVIIAVLARLIAVSLPLNLLNPIIAKEKGEILILTWAGLRGGISIALALSLPESEIKPIILTATYSVVVFSILIQGLTIESLIKRFHNE